MSETDAWCCCRRRCSAGSAKFDSNASCALYATFWLLKSAGGCASVRLVSTARLPLQAAPCTCRHQPKPHGPTRPLTAPAAAALAPSPPADSMGFSPDVLRAIKRKGYRLPTPIQRRAMPMIMQGLDVVGMARTGSGKTAAFVLPMIHR